MFGHIFINRLKCIVRDKALIFWNLAFPLILATFFYLAFSNLTSGETFKTIDIAVVNNAAYRADTPFQDLLKGASQGDVKLFHVSLGTREEAEKLLDDGKVAGYITVDKQIRLTVKNSGFDQTIIKSVLDQYSQTVSAVGNIVKENPEALRNGLSKDIGDNKEYTRSVQIGKQNKPDPSVNYFYTLIAMACLYGSFLGLKELTDSQADLSKRGARLNVAPVHKLKVLVAGLSAGYIVLVLEILILLSYLVFALKIDFGNQIGYILLTCLAGSAAGISFGALIGALVRKREGVKMAILIGIAMLASFLSGMMYENMKYIIKKSVPLLAYINPASLITDAFYALYYYDTHTRYFVNIGLLGGFTVLFCLVTYLITRRQKYASI